MRYSLIKTTERYYGRVKEAGVNERMLEMDRARDVDGCSRTGGNVWVRTQRMVGF